MSLNRHCSLSGQGSWTDLVSNVSAVDPSLLDADVDALLGFGAAPKAMALDLMHEATHQWCFASPVGSTLAYLHARAVSMATWSHFGHEIPQGEFYEDVLRFVTAREILRPLAEGLAMFLELDANTEADTDFMSLPMEAAFLLFVDRAIIDEDDLSDREKVTSALHVILKDARMSEAALKRRVTLLAAPLSLSYGGYLPGYLAVKTLWLESAGMSEDTLPLTSADLFASYLRNYIYCDYSLVDVLLDPRTSGQESIAAIVDHIKTRLYEFLRVVSVPEDLYMHEVLARTADNLAEFGEDPRCRSITSMSPRTSIGGERQSGERSGSGPVRRRTTRTTRNSSALRSHFRRAAITCTSRQRAGPWMSTDRGTPD